MMTHLFTSTEESKFMMEGCAAQRGEVGLEEFVGQQNIQL